MSARVVPEAIRWPKGSHPRRSVKAPYSRAEQTQLLASAKSARSAKRRADLAALISLGLATGASGQELAWIRPGDIEVDETGVAVFVRRRGQTGRFRERRVVALHRFAEAVAALRHRTPGSYVLGGGSSRHSRVYDLCQSSKGRWPVELDAARLRSSYLCEIASSAHTLPELVEAAGVTTLEVFDDLLCYLRTREASGATPDAPPLFAG